MKSHYLLAFACLCVVFHTINSQENLASDVRASQSTTNRHLAQADNAIDGNNDCNFSHGSCSKTRRQRNPWWRVDLGRRFHVFVVRITSGCRRSESLNGAVIRVGDSLEDDGNTNSICANITAISRGQPTAFSCASVGLIGRFVNIILPTRRRSLTLCEVEVFGGPAP
uniref:fucolectin-like n=1 Tax=Pristiophorus japonicus TaxID=55135 RepID=UPI00398F17D7